MRKNLLKFVSPAASHIFACVLAMVVFMAMSMMVLAAPGGPTLTYNYTDNGPATGTYSRSDNKGTITTTNFSFIQQNGRWKAYIGNVTGSFALRDSANYTIYAWNVSSSSGEVYSTRASTVVFENISCASASNITNEDAALNHAVGNTDTIMKTFWTKSHVAFSVGNVAITANTCNSTTTYVSSAGNPSTYREVLMWDNASAFIYSSLLNYSATGYNGATYDFQMLVGEDDTLSSATPYYFYVELM